MRRKRIWILVGIALAAGGLLYLLSSLSVRARETSHVDTTIEDFNLGRFYHTGMTLQDDGEVTLLRLGIAGTWITANVTSMPSVFGHAMVEHNGYVYVLGGILDGSVIPVPATSAVYVARINPDTYMLDSFVETAPLPYSNGIASLGAVVVGEYVYALGGNEPVSENPYLVPTTTVLFARFNADGTLGNWTRTTPMPGPRARVPAVELNGVIYVVGGQDHAGDAATETVLYAQPNPSTGQITQWYTATGDMPYPSFGHMVATDGERLYVLGGYKKPEYTPGSPQPLVHYATPLSTTGDITAGGWISTAVMPTPLFGGVAFAFNGELLVIGGTASVLWTPADFARAALLDLDGSIISEQGQAWYESPALSPDRTWHAGVTSSDRRFIYILGGTNKNKPFTYSQLNRGSMTGQGGGRFARSGWYIAPTIELGRERKILGFDWTVELPSTDVGITLQYRTRLIGEDWGEWSAPLSPQGSLGVITSTVPFEEGSALRFEYRANFSTQNVSQTAVLRRFELIYDVAEQPTFSKQASPPDYYVKPGQTITYTLGFYNPNSYALRNAQITDTLPQYMTYVPGSITFTVDAGIVITADDSSAPVLRWSMPSLPSRAGGVLRLKALVNADAPQNVAFCNEATLATNNTDPQLAAVCHVFSNNPPTLSKQAEPPDGSPVAPGDTITYTLSVAVSGGGAQLQNVKLRDALPPHVTLTADSCAPACEVSPGGGILTWTIGTLNPGQSWPASFAVRVNSQVTDGVEIQNKANLIVGGISTLWSNVTHHTVRVPYDLVVTKSDGVKRAAPGQTLNYTLRYTNVVPSGVITVTNVVITDRLEAATMLGGVPALVTCCGAFAPGTPGLVSPTLAVFQLGALGPNQAGSLQVSVKVDNPLPPASMYPVLSLRNHATIGDDGQHGLEASPINNWFADSTILRGPDLALRNIRGVPARTFPNALLNLQVDLVNEGLSPATSWEITNTAEFTKWYGVELYIKPAGFALPDAPLNPRDHAGGFCANAKTCNPDTEGRYDYMGYVVDGGGYPLGVDEFKTLRISPKQSPFKQTGVYSLYLQADIAKIQPPDPLYGRVMEADEFNNVVFLGRVVVTTDLPKVYLPLVLRQR